MTDEIKNLPLKLAVTRFGNRLKFIAKVNAILPDSLREVTINMMLNWYTGKVPTDYCPAIKVATKGITTMHELRPDFYDRDDKVIMPIALDDVEPEIPKTAEA